jgi:protein involved in plasmid replication-relaxation
MQTSAQPLKGAEKILVLLAAFDYLTASQITLLAYAPNSLRFVRGKLNALVAAGFVICLPGRVVTQPRVYTLTGAGYTYASALGVATAKRVRPTEERDKAKNLLFLQHTLAVSDVLIAAHLLSQTHPQISLTRLYTERSLKRKISVTLPDNRTIYIEPDASCEFAVTETWHKTPQTWQEFFHIEVYRHLPPEPRFKQKVQGYVTAVDTGQHAALFKTEALSIAVLCTTVYQTATLTQWTEEALQGMGRAAEGERFFFRTIDTATASPEDMFLSPVWKQAFGTTTTPLLVLE